MRAKAIWAAALAASAVCCGSLPTPALARGSVVSVKDDFPAGTIVVRESQRRLYLMLGAGRAISYPVGVGRHGMQWSGTVQIDGKYVEPAWAPPASIKRENPRLPDVIPGGSPHNPMGVAAMTLSGGGQYAIHGTNQPNLIGGFISHGCIRMYNADVTDLFGRVSVGTTVVVTKGQ
jgi:lipoprotein-anchoring transpeptidase ErfK/SrfK